MARYQTEQKKMLLAYFSSHPGQQFSAEEVATAFLGLESENEKAPGKSTVYRLVSEMANDGLLRRFPKTDGGRGWLYQYHNHHDCAGHLHLKCTACGQLRHLECELSGQLLSHIANHHPFKVDNTQSVLYGLCENCRREDENL